MSNTLAGELPAYLQPADASGVTGHAVSTYRNWRSLGIGPAYVKVGGKVLYPRADFIAWLTGGAA